MAENHEPYEDVDRLVLAAETSCLSKSSGWVQLGPLHVYMRVGQRYLDGERRPCIDVANATCEDPGKGAFGRLLDYIETKYMGYTIVAEIVTNPRLEVYLRRRGYQLIEDPSGLGHPSYAFPARHIDVDYALLEARTLEQLRSL